MNRPVLLIITFYQTCVSPYLPPMCRFTPTCSNYAKTAFTKYHFGKAFYLTVVRILKCNPFHKGGYDPLK